MRSSLRSRASPHIEPVFTAQVLTYLRITQLRLGLILNFNAAKLIDGLKRVVR
jgi:GxxExxY protein